MTFTKIFKASLRGLVTGLLLTSSTLQAWDSMSPTFTQNGDIIFAARGGACGRMKLDKRDDVVLTYNNKAADLVIKSFRTNYSNDDYNFENRLLGEIVYKGIPQVFSYDWAGPVKQVYRVQCFLRTNIANKDYDVKKDCAEVIQVESIYHNEACRPWHRANELNTSVFKKVRSIK